MTVAKYDRILDDIETRMAPWQLVLGGVTAGAALFGAAIAFVKILGG